MQETQVPSLGQEDPLEEEMAARSSILSWEILSGKVEGEVNKNVQGSGERFRINNMGTHCRNQKEGGHKKNDGMASF